MYWLGQGDRKRNGISEKDIGKSQRSFMKNRRIEEMGKRGNTERRNVIKNGV
jgi:hypothetical protein